ncbi:hypothetical protein TcWFU_008983 [Taenia crassiceps]|uniref:Uncharacterized protein n=1 Tax=Taenia crassiceps TaxID=6207 RepID=A0ABR4Q0C8_9CEST
MQIGCQIFQFGVLAGLLSHRLLHPTAAIVSHCGGGDCGCDFLGNHGPSAESIKCHLCRPRSRHVSRLESGLRTDPTCSLGLCLAHHLPLKDWKGSTFALPSDPCLGECRKRSQQRSQAHVYARTHIHIDLIVVLLCDSDVLYTNRSSVESLLACVNYCGQPDYMCRPDINRISQGTPSRLAYVDFPPKVALLTISGKSHASDHIQSRGCNLPSAKSAIFAGHCTPKTEVLHKSQSEPRSWSSKKLLMFPKLDTNRLPHALHPIALLHAWIEISAESSSSFSQLPGGQHHVKLNHRQLLGCVCVCGWVMAKARLPLDVGQQRRANLNSSSTLSFVSGQLSSITSFRLVSAWHAERRRSEEKNCGLSANEQDLDVRYFVERIVKSVSQAGNKN